MLIDIVKIKYTMCLDSYTSSREAVIIYNSYIVTIVNISDNIP